MRRQSLRRGLIFISFLLFPVTQFYFSPYLSVRAAAEGIVSGCLAVFALLFLTSLVFGRAWCAWACPGGGLQEACAAVNPKPVGGRRWIKYLIFWPWFGSILVLTALAGGFHDFQPFYRTVNGVSFAAPYAWAPYYLVIGLVVILAFTFGRRAVCHYGCWMAPFMVAGTKLKSRFGWPSLHLEAEPAKCNGCRTCTKNCPMSLDIGGMVQKGSVESSDCILCGACVDSCRKGAVHYAFFSSTPSRSPKAGLGSEEC